MRKYLFIALISIIIISLLVIYFFKIRNDLEAFLPVSQHETERAFTSDSIQSAITTIVDAVESSSSGVSSEESTGTNTFIIYIDRYYKIDKEASSDELVTYSRYIQGGEWFKLCDNYNSGSITNTLKDITVHKNNDGLIYIYAIYGNIYGSNKICRRSVDDYEDTWEHLTLFDTIDKPTQIYSSSNYLLVNANEPSDSSDDNSDNFGVFSYNFESEQLQQISLSTNYLCIRVNLYLSREVFYGIFEEEDNQLTVKRAIDEDKDEELEYDDSFDFDITFVDLYETSYFIYGLGNDSYIYRKSTKINVLGNESSSWYKVSSKIPSTYSDNDIGESKKLSVYGGYIYCLISDKIMKHRINGYTWVDINNFNFENQYHGNPPSIIINRINDSTRKNIDPDVNNLSPLGDFKFGTYDVDIDSLES